MKKGLEGKQIERNKAKGINVLYNETKSDLIHISF